MPSASSQAAVFMGQYGAEVYCVYSVHSVNRFAISKKINGPLRPAPKYGAEMP